METYTAKQLRERSIIQSINHRYKWMICDGDSKSHLAVKDIWTRPQSNQDGLNWSCRKKNVPGFGYLMKEPKRKAELWERCQRWKRASHIWRRASYIRTQRGDHTAQRIYHNTIRQYTNPEALGDEDKMKAVVQTMKTAILAVLHHECKIPDKIMNQVQVVKTHFVISRN